MATSNEPAQTVTPATQPTDAQKRVFVYDTNTKQKLPYPVPTSWLDGRFPHLKEQPSKKEGK